MSADSLIALLLGVPVGIISGLYSWLIVARYQRFSDLRSILLRIIHEIDFMGEGSHIVFPARKDVPEFSHVASDLYFLRHERAGNETLRLQNEITKGIYEGAGGLTLNSSRIAMRNGNEPLDV